MFEIALSYWEDETFVCFQGKCLKFSQYPKSVLALSYWEDETFVCFKGVKFRMGGGMFVCLKIQVTR